MINAILLLQDSAGPGPLDALRHNCRSLLTACNEDEVRKLAPKADTIAIVCPQQRLPYWLSFVSNLRDLPYVWVCMERPHPLPSQWKALPDGILFSSMTADEIGAALALARHVCQQRLKWNSERDQLLQRLEERKWIEQAKGVLCQTKGITEAQAYDLLRKQAMNERKRIGELAHSIVKVYQIINN